MDGEIGAELGPTVDANVGPRVGGRDVVGRDGDGVVVEVSRMPSGIGASGKVHGRFGADVDVDLGKKKGGTGSSEAGQGNATVRVRIAAGVDDDVDIEFVRGRKIEFVVRVVAMRCVAADPVVRPQKGDFWLL